MYFSIFNIYFILLIFGQFSTKIYGKSLTIFPTRGISNSNFGGTAIWTSPNLITECDNQPTQIDFLASDVNDTTSELLVASFANQLTTLPTQGSVTGIQLNLIRGCVTSQRVSDSGVFLRINGTTSDNFADMDEFWSTTGPAKTSFGNSTFLWGFDDLASKSPSELENSRFGIQIVHEAGGRGRCGIDCISMTIYFTESTLPPTTTSNTIVTSTSMDTTSLTTENLPSTTTTTTTAATTTPTTNIESTLLTISDSSFSQTQSQSPTTTATTNIFPTTSTTKMNVESTTSVTFSTAHPTTSTRTVKILTAPTSSPSSNNLTTSSTITSSASSNSTRTTTKKDKTIEIDTGIPFMTTNNRSNGGFVSKTLLPFTTNNVIDMTNITTTIKNNVVNNIDESNDLDWLIYLIIILAIFCCFGMIIAVVIYFKRRKDFNSNEERRTSAGDDIYYADVESYNENRQVDPDADLQENNNIYAIVPEISSVNHTDYDAPSDLIDSEIIYEDADFLKGEDDDENNYATVYLDLNNTNDSNYTEITEIKPPNNSNEINPI